MKKCQCCGFEASADAWTCPACGEQSWLDMPASPAAETPSEAPTDTARAARRRK